MPRAPKTPTSPSTALTLPSTHALFDHLAASIAGGRGDRAATLWQMPALVIDDEAVRPVASPAEIASFSIEAHAEDETRGIVRARPEILRESWLSDRIVSVDVRWSRVDAGGKERRSEVVTYVLRIDEVGALRIRVAVVHGEGADPAPRS